MIKVSLKPLPYQVRADLFHSLASMEKAGLPAQKAVALLHLAGEGKSRLDKLRHLMSRGADIASAGEKSSLFTSLEVSMLRAALHAGSPAITYRRLADSYSQHAQQIATIRSRLTLPILILLIALLVLPLPSLVAGSLSSGAYLLQVLMPIALLVAVFYLAKQLIHWYRQAPSTRTQVWLAMKLINLPVFGEMHVRGNNCDFFANMALMLEAGIPMFDALPKAVDTIGNTVIREDFSRIKQQMTQGATLAQAVEELNYVANPQMPE